MVPSAWETALSTPAGIGLDASESGERGKVIFRHVRPSSEIFNKRSSLFGADARQGRERNGSAANPDVQDTV